MTDNQNDMVSEQGSPSTLRGTPQTPQVLQTPQILQVLQDLQVLRDLQDLPPEQGGDQKEDTLNKRLYDFLESSEETSVEGIQEFIDKDLSGNEAKILLIFLLNKDRSMKLAFKDLLKVALERSARGSGYIRWCARCGKAYLNSQPAEENPCGHRSVRGLGLGHIPTATY